MTSQALQTNLARTAVPIHIPEDQLILLEISVPMRGIHEAASRLLREANHPYPNWNETLEDLHRSAAGSFYYYNRHERGAEGLAVFSRLYALVVHEEPEQGTRQAAVRRWLSFLTKLTKESGDRFERNAPVLREALADLAAVLAEYETLDAPAAPALKRLVAELADRHLASAEPELEDALAILLASLETSVRHWLDRPDPIEWYRELAADIPLTGGWRPPALDRISHESLAAARNQLSSLAAESALRPYLSELLEFPDDARIAQTYLDVAEDLAAPPAAGDPLLRAQWLVRVLENDGLAQVHEAALRELGRSCSGVLRNGTGTQQVAFLRQAFALLREGQLPLAPTGLRLIERLGRVVLELGDPALVRVFVDEVATVDFQYPEFSGFTDEWEVRANPAHVQIIRTLLSLVEVDPVLARPLLNALVPQLKLGGVLLADTDLFQKDVSSLLGRSVQPVYLQVKHLLRLLPVYFEQIGAEGTLREVSTRLDEIRGRADPLCHFLRKQSHVACNPELVGFVDEIARFWATGDRTPLRRYVPSSIFANLDIDEESHRGPHAAFTALLHEVGDFELALSLDRVEVERLLSELEAIDEVDREKVTLLLDVRREIRAKYELDHDDLIKRLRRFRRVDRALVDELEDAEETHDHGRSLAALLSVLEDLKAIILSPEETEPLEDIYHKRHIAAGIPSMYGRYREDRLEAMGLTFRGESLGTALFEQCIADEDLSHADPVCLRRVAALLHLLLRALRIDGFRAQGLAQSLSMLDEALEAPETSRRQYLDVFQLISRSIESLISTRILNNYEDAVQLVVRRLLARGLLERTGHGDLQEDVLRYGEAFLQDLIAGSFGLQQLDTLVGGLLQTLHEEEAGAQTPAATPGPAPDLERCVVPLSAGESLPGIVQLGNKGYMLRHLKQLGFPVPEGFVLTTELFRARETLLCGTPREEFTSLVMREVGTLESASGARFGDPAAPLLLSVRSGAPISMPGMLESFLNVGINEEIAAGMSAEPRCAWAAWDAYRRFLQFWGMNHGLERDLFDELIRDAKHRHSVPKKALLSPARMRELAMAYRELLLDHGTAVTDDPVEQLIACIELVFDSWDGEKAALYRRELHIADEWGTGVIVQRMVFGNLDRRSGTGVVLTGDPDFNPEAVEPNGDFVIQGQGEDVVSGLVETFPISETQRRSESRDSSLSLETSYPEIYGSLTGIARSLVTEHGMNQQEIEFTFEGDRPSDLYILQTRDTVVAQSAVVPTFEPTDELEQSWTASGIGVSGGALSGRVAHDSEEIAWLKDRYPGDAVILLRPDTVPDDIPLVLQADGLLTAIGGATSHAAVAAKRLSKTCVVRCRPFDVDAHGALSAIGGHVMSAGELVSINGIDGSVYIGSHPITLVRVLGRT